MADIHKNDVGTALVVAFVDEDGAVLNISTASTKQIRLRKPGGTVVTKSGTFDTTGADGLLKYTTTKTGGVYDLDTVGRWQIQGYAVVGTQEWNTAVSTFEVAGNLE